VRDERRQARVSTIARLMRSGRWTATVQKQLREHWKATGDCDSTAEFGRCVIAARAAVQCEIAEDETTTGWLLNTVREHEQELASAMYRHLERAKMFRARADALLKANNIKLLWKVEFLATRHEELAARCHRDLQGYHGLLLGHHSEGTELARIPPEEVLKMLAAQYCPKDGQPDGTESCGAGSKQALGPSGDPSGDEAQRAPSGAREPEQARTEKG